VISSGGKYTDAECEFGIGGGFKCATNFNGVATCNGDLTQALTCQKGYFLYQGSCRECAPGATSVDGNGALDPTVNPYGTLKEAAAFCFCPNSFWGLAAPFAVEVYPTALKPENPYGCQSCGAHVTGPGTFNAEENVPPAKACTSCEQGYIYEYADRTQKLFALPTCKPDPCPHECPPTPPTPPSPPKPDPKKCKDNKGNECACPEPDSKKDKKVKKGKSANRSLREMGVDGELVM
jgi:hypothetical protein